MHIRTLIHVHIKGDLLQPILLVVHMSLKYPPKYFDTSLPFYSIFADLLDVTEQYFED